MRLLQPWAMLPNGPPWTSAGVASSVWTRLGLIASFMRTAIAPAARSSRRDERPVTLLGDDHALDARLEVLEIARQAEDGHDLRGHRDVEAALAGHPVSRAAQTDDEAAQRAVVHIEHAFPEDPPDVEPERIALRQMIVQDRKSTR